MNGPTHRLVAGFAVGLYVAEKERKVGQPTAMPLVSGFAASLLTNLPDILEPATAPNHRAFFHSIVFAALVGGGIHKVYQWQPESELERFLKGLALLTGSAYLIHLALDLTTKKGLPLLGRA